MMLIMQMNWLDGRVGSALPSDRYITGQFREREVRVMCPPPSPPPPSWFQVSFSTNNCTEPNGININVKPLPEICYSNFASRSRNFFYEEKVCPLYFGRKKRSRRCFSRRNLSPRKCSSCYMLMSLNDLQINCQRCAVTHP